MKNKTTIMNEMKEGLMIIPRNTKSSNVILSYCIHFVFFLNKP